MDSSQTSSEVQPTVAVVAAPVESTNARGEVLFAPVAWFQLLSATTPATSVGAIWVPRPTKSMLIAFSDTPELVRTRLAVAVCVNDPLVPVTIMVELPIGVLVLVVIVNVVVPDVATEVGANVPAAPVGVPDTAKFTVPLKPFSAPTVTV